MIVVEAGPARDAGPACATHQLASWAGVQPDQLARLAAKELADNALDAAGAVTTGVLRRGPGLLTFFVADAGPGIAGGPARIAGLFATGPGTAPPRPSKLPTRGMLGAGLRVVAEVVAAAGGTLRVSTNGESIVLDPAVGAARVLDRAPWDGAGTQVEVTLRDRAADETDADALFAWADEAAELAAGVPYAGASSSWWYTAEEFRRRLAAAGDEPVGRFVESLEGCRKGAKKAAGPDAGRACAELDAADAAALLSRLRAAARPVNPTRLGRVGPRAGFQGYSFPRTGVHTRGRAVIPSVVEVWARRAERPGVQLYLNRTPVASRLTVARDRTHYVLFGAGLGSCLIEAGRPEAEYHLGVSLLTPSVEFLGSGKSPSLEAVRDKVVVACGKALRAARKAAPSRCYLGCQHATCPPAAVAGTPHTGPVETHRFAGERAPR